MKKILCLCTIVLMMFGMFACETEQGSNEEETKTEKSGVSDGTVLTLTLNNQGATGGTSKIYLKYNVGYYLDKNCKKEITDETGAIDIPVKTGFTFCGYNADKAGKGQAVITAEGLLDLDAGYTDFKADTTLYAQWEKLPAHNIEYYNTKDVSNDNQTVFLEAEGVSLKNLSLTGWRFDGWYDASEDGTKIESWIAGAYTDDVTLWARWTANVYSLTYKDKDNAELSGELPNNYPINHTYGTDTTLPIPTKEHYDFLGWYMTYNCSGDGMFTLEAEAITDNTILYAKWGLHDYTITYSNVLDGTHSSQSTFTVDDSVTLSDADRRGYTFDGWYDDESAGSQVTSWNAMDKTDNVEVWARWTANTYSITYKDMNNEAFSGVHGVNYPTTHTYDNVTELVSPTKNGYTFVGWYSTAECDGNIKTELGSTDYIDNITLYAKWFWGYECSAEDLGDILAILEADGEPYQIAITDGNPDLSVIRTALTSNISVNVELDLSQCSNLTAISDDAFSGCTNLTEIVMPDSVLSVGDNAFYNCSSLTEIVIPDNVTSIGDAFNGCSGLTSLILGANVATMKIGSYINTLSERSGIWDNCKDIKNLVITEDVASIPEGLLNGFSSLESLTIPFVGDQPHESTDTYQYPFGYIFGTSEYTGGTSTTQYYYGNSTYNTTSTSYYIPTSLKSVTITSSSYIPYGAFYNCSKLTSVMISDSMTSIGSRAFCNCGSLTSVTIPDSVTIIDGYTFEGCSSLTSVVIGSGVTSIGNSAFKGCSGLTKVDYTGTIAGWCGISFSSYDSNPLHYAHNLYINGELVTDLVIPNTVTEIKRYAFRNCSSLTSVTIPNRVMDIGDSAFSGCSGLTSVTIPDSVTSISSGAFSGCSGLTSVIIPDGVTSIGNSAFENCSGLTSVTIPNSVTSIGSSVFKNCRALTSVAIPNNVTSISNSAFENCSGLTSITIPNGVTSIGNSVFENCSGLTSITIPNGVTSIGNSVFKNCKALTSVTIPNTVTSIGEYAFYGCQNLLSITIPNGVTSIEKFTFTSCSKKLTSITIPDSVTTIFTTSFWNCFEMTTVTVKSITPPIFEQFAPYYNIKLFESCNALTTIYVPSTSVEAYKAASGWKVYADKIVAGDF